MEIFTDMIKEIEAQLPLLCEVADLVKLGMFVSKSEARCRRTQGYPPKYIRFSSRRIAYPKAEVLKYLHYKCTLSEKPYNEVKGTLRGNESLTDGGGQSADLFELEELRKVSKLRCDRKEDSSGIMEHCTNVIAIRKMREEKKTRKRAIPKVIKVEIPSGSRFPVGSKKFLSIKEFAMENPSFTEGFLRNQMKNPDFVKKAVIRIATRIFIRVDGFWEFLDTRSSELES